MSMTFKCGLLTAIFSLIFSMAQAANLYVDGGAVEPNATWNSANGSSYSCSHGTGRGYSTIAAAVAAMSSGDDIYIRGGTYNEIQINLKGMDGTSENYCSMQSYPGEWAIINGNHSGSGDQRSVIYSTTSVHFWKFERLEITGGGASDASASYGAGIMLYSPSHVIFRYLYVHDNYAITNAGASAGLHFSNGGGDGAARNLVIEYSHIKANGNPFGTHNTANANIAIYSDYKYTNAVDLSSAMSKNTIRYNLIDGAHPTGYTDVGITHKAFQRLTGYMYGESGTQTDNLPNGTLGRTFGDKIHHNIIINHEMGMRADQDYVQFYNNIIWLSNKSASESHCAWAGRDHWTSRRGSFWPCVYNNTIYGDEGSIHSFAVGSNYSGGTSAATDKTFIVNNIINGHNRNSYFSMIYIGPDLYDSLSGFSTPKPIDISDLKLSRNFFYSCSGSSYVKVYKTTYDKAGIQATSAADMIWAKNTPSPFLGSSGANKYRTSGSYPLDNTHTVSNGGLGGNHPYLPSVTIPSYVGATNPTDDSWVNGVLSMNSTWFRYQKGGSMPSWIEGSGSQTTNPVSDSIAPPPPIGIKVEMQ